jgi:CheY-like chemotaxis protein
MPHETILVVDDSPTDLKLMTSPLEEKGYRVLTAEWFPGLPAAQDRSRDKEHQDLNADEQDTRQ